MKLGKTTFFMTLVASMAGATFAQQTPEKSKRVLEEVMVTAQKTAKSLQDVPVSVSALSGDFIQENGLSDLVEVSAYVPNVRVEYTSPSSPQVFIRGFGTNAFNPSFEPAVGLVQDEIFYGRGSYFTESMFDVQRVEVLRGPQGTLFGKNTIAGVFNVSTNPAPAEAGVEGNVQYNGGEFGEQRLEAGVGYRGDGNWGLRGALLLTDREGRFDNTKLDRKEDERNQEAFRLAFLWQPTDTVDIDVVAQNSRRDLNFWPRQLTNIDDDTRDYLIQFDPELEGDPFNYQTSFDHPGDMFTGSDSLMSRAKIALKPIWGLNTLDTTVVVGASQLDVRQNQDLDVSPAALLVLDEVDDYRQYTAEWRFSGTADSLFGWGSNVEFIAGLYYFESSFNIIADVIGGDDLSSYILTEDAAQLLSGNSNAPGSPLGGFGGALPGLTSTASGNDFYRFDFTQDVEAQSFFGQVVWDLNDKWTLTPGIRINREAKDSVPKGTSFCDNKDVQPCVTAAVISANDYAPGTIRRVETNVSPKLSLHHYFNEDVSMYTSITRGFKSGGVNAISFTGNNLEFEPEKAVSFEVGLRSELLDNTLKLNATVYRMDFDDLQVLAFNGLLFDVTNAAAAFSQGLEMDVQWLTPYAPLTINGSFGYLDAQYKDYEGAPSPVSNGLGELQDLSGETLAFAPKYSGVLSPTLEYPLGDMMVKLGVNISYQHSHFTDTDLDPNTEIPSTTIYSANAGLRSVDKGWSLGVGVKNLTDKRVLNQVIDTAFFPGTFNPSQAPGREAFLTLSYRL